MEEDKSLSDGDGTRSLEEPGSPQIGGKKLKLNDGSSQDSLQETGPGTSKEENIDSGISPDKSDSICSDDRAASSSAGPSNELVHGSASDSNVKAILMNIRHPNRNRNYRKRKTPDQDSDSNASVDSDDLSVDESTQNVPDLESASDTSDPLQTDLLFMDRTPTDSNNSNSSSSSSSNSGSPSVNYEDSYGSDGLVRILSGDTDTDGEGDGPWRPRPPPPPDDSPDTLPDVLLKEQPKHNYLLLKEIINREMGLTFPYGKTTKEDVMFSQRFYGSLHSVYRLQKLHSLNKHRGCVNSINFHPEGQLLVSGSDDMNIVVWDWARNKAHQTIKTGHKSNVFQSKFLYLNAQSQLNIVTCARDGQVRLIQCPPSGGEGVRRRLCSHSRAAHKLHVSAHEPHSVLSAGEDGMVMHVDVRHDHPNRLLHVKDNNHSVPLYSVHGNPLEPKEFIVAGRDRFIRMYDRRKCVKPTATYAPTFCDKTQPIQLKTRLSMTHLTCAIYNHNGREILGSYNDEDVFLFDVEKDVYKKENDEALSIGGYSKRYSGHLNSATFKGVSFFGPHSEYVVSGSDCAHFYVWSRDQEAIVQWIRADVSGVVNCIETHPKSPVLATSGLDKDVKIWVPRAATDPTFDGLEKRVRENSASQLRSPLFNDFLPTLYSAWRSETRDDPDTNLSAMRDAFELDGNVCTTF